MLILYLGPPKKCSATICTTFKTGSLALSSSWCIVNNLRLTDERKHVNPVDIAFKGTLNLPDQLSHGGIYEDSVEDWNLTCLMIDSFVGNSSVLPNGWFPKLKLLVLLR